jgi:DNA repair exonuclease SbcCD nuclease subunit
MAAEPPTILCAGDLHLGRHPTRIPAEHDGPSCSPKGVWRRVVDTAVKQDVTAVLLSGDIIDQENRYFEAYGAFENGASRLDEAGIETLVVTGNHDAESLPDLVESLDIPHLRLLGKEQTWERHTVTRDGEPLFHVDGWSFAQRHVLSSPLRDYDPEPAEEPVIGLLHADFDGRGSEYAPVQRSEFEATTVDTWVLGHIHAPGVQIDADPCVFYPGSLQPLDPGESGVHGAWTLRLDASGVTSPKQQPLASVCYDTVEVDVSDIETATQAPERIQTRVKAELDGRDTSALDVFVARVHLTGRTESHGDLLQRRVKMVEDLQFRVETVPIVVEKLEVATEPDVDLSSLADGDSPVAYLAELLLTLEGGDETESFSELRTAALEATREVHTHGTYSPLHAAGRLEHPDESTATAVLREQARVLLHELRSQEESIS